MTCTDITQRDAGRFVNVAKILCTERTVEWHVNMAVQHATHKDTDAKSCAEQPGVVY